MLTREEAIKIQHLYSICTQCERDIVELLKQQPEQPRRKVIHTFVTVINYDKETRKSRLSITQTCNDGTVFISEIEIEGDSVGYDVRKLPPIPQDEISCPMPKRICEKCDGKGLIQYVNEKARLASGPLICNDCGGSGLPNPIPPEGETC